MAHPAHAYPPAWIREAQCIHRAESGGYGWNTGWAIRSNPASRGGMQFLWSTWASAVARHRLRGYPADPADATRAQQVYVAWLLYVDDNRSWHEWSTAAGCGLR